MIVIALNFFAGILVHLLDPKHLKHMVVEGAKDKIHAAAHAAIGQRAGEIAPRIAERVAAYWEDQITQEMIGHMPPSTRVAQLPAASSPPATPAQLPAVSYRSAAVPPVTGELSEDLFAQIDGQVPGANGGFPELLVGDDPPSNGASGKPDFTVGGRP